MEITKGKSVTVRTAFKKRGIALSFANPHVWKLYNSKNQVLMSGTATADGSRWAASFTIPTSYIVPDGSEELEVEFIGYSGKNEYARSKEITLLDESEGLRSNNIVYSIITPSKLKSSIIVPYEELEYITLRVTTPYSTVMYTHPTSVNPAYKTKTKMGYEYAFDVGTPDLVQALKYTEPVHLVIEAKPVDEDPIIEVHPVYVLNSANAGLINAMQQYLDKARLIEIDPSLQWTTDEYLHYLNEGISYINSAGDPATFWSIGAYPSNLRTMVLYAACWHALNARYLAEGFNAFEFTGLNTQLNFDRRDAIATKMNELQGVLDSKLPLARAAGVRAFGIGTPPGDSGQTSSSAINSGVLGVGIGPMTNSYRVRTGRYPLRRLF